MDRTMKILLGYDGSTCADAAIDDLLRAGLPEKAETVVLSVAEVWLPPPPPSMQEIIEEAREVKVPADLRRVYARGSKQVQHARELADQAAQRVRTKFPGWQVSSEAACGTPAWELISKADEWKPDLVVVGSHGRTGINRLMLGSISQRVLTEAKCGVRVSRGRVEEPGLPVRILIGVDGSAASEAAVTEVGRRHWPQGTEVRIVIAEDPLTPTFIGKLIPPIAEMVEETNVEELEWIDRELSRCRSMLDNDDLQVSTEVREGEPKKVLIEVADQWRADCIFMGAVGFSNRFERFVLGSVSAAVAARASCSVEVVR